MKERRGLGSDWEFMRYDADLYSQEEALIEQATKYLYRAIDIKENLEDLEDKEAFEAFIKDITGHLEKRIKTLCALLENKLDLNGIAEKVTKVRNQIQEARSELTNYNTKQDKSAAFAYLREIEEGLINKHTKRQEELNTPDSGVFNTMAYQVNNLADLVGRYLIEKETGNAVDYQENGKELLRQINNLREITEACYQVVCDVSMIQEVGIGNELMDQDLAQKEGILSRLQVLENQLNNSDKLKKEANHASREAITHAAQKAVEEIISTDEGKKESRCNEGVNLAFEKLTGSKELAGKRANQMIEHCASSPNWEEIDISQAQELANQGYIVVAGWHSLSTTKSGHIALVVPGEEEKSNSWGCNVPKTMDTGENQRWACKKMTEGFGKNKKERTKFYRYKGPIKKIIN